jgi:hypothetical protein
MRHSVTPVRTACLLAAGVAVLSLSGSWCSKANAQTLSPLTTFGSNGWLAPGSNPYIGDANNERGLGWNPVTKNIVLPSRNGGNFVAIIDGTTGAVVKTMDTTGVSGGTLAMMGAGVSDDGAIYVPNLSSGTTPSSSPFKIYKWTGENDTNAPTTAFSQVNPPTTTGVWRFGDAFDVYGSGTAAKFASAGSTTGTSSSLANNGNFMIGQLDGSNANTIYRAIPNTLTASNDYRLSIAFVDADTIIGNQGASAKFTDFVAATTLSNTGAIITGSVALGAADRPLDYTVINGQALMAVVNTNSSLISIYDVTNPAAASLLTTGSTVSGALTANANATGGLQWGEMISPTSQILYAMSSNQGIQAMVFQAVPEPSTYAVMAGAFAVIGVVASRKRKIAA